MPLTASRSNAVAARVLRWSAALVAAAIFSYLAFTYAACIARSCSTSRFDIVFLAGLAIAASAVAVSLLAWHRFTPALLVVALPCFAGVYLFEAVATSAYDRNRLQMLEELRRHQARGQAAVPLWTPYGFAAGKGFLQLSD